MDSYPIVIGADVEEILKEENVKVTPQSKAEKLTSLIAPNKDTAEEKQIKELKENKKKPFEKYKR